MTIKQQVEEKLIALRKDGACCCVCGFITLLEQEIREQFFGDTGGGFGGAELQKTLIRTALDIVAKKHLMRPFWDDRVDRMRKGLAIYLD